MPFSEDYRKFSFPSLDKLKNKKGELVTKHHNFPTKEMMDSMDTYVDKMDLMKEGEPQESG
jgi:ATP-dependent DNA helicase 2 subunit 2